MRRAALLSVLVGLGLLGAPAVRAQDTEVVIADAEVIAGNGGDISEGGSATVFGLRLPDGAECPGDSADDGWRVNSYMVPDAVSPTEVTYDGLGPKPQGKGDLATFRQPLYDVETNWYVSALTEDAEELGEPGLIIDIPAFDFDQFLPGDIPAGRYHLGIVCTLVNEIARVWDAEIDVTADADDLPAGIRWAVVGADDSDDDAGAPIALILVGGLVVLAGAAVLIRRRQPTRRPPGRNS